jgi:hypothetical protein
MLMVVVGGVLTLGLMALGVLEVLEDGVVLLVV